MFLEESACAVTVLDRRAPSGRAIAARYTRSTPSAHPSNEYTASARRRPASPISRRSSGRRASWLDASGQLTRIVGLGQQSGLAVNDDLADAPSSHTDHGQPGGHGLDDDPAERLAVGRVHQDVDLIHDFRLVLDKAGPGEPLGQARAANLRVQRVDVVIAGDSAALRRVVAVNAPLDRQRAVDP